MDYFVYLLPGFLLLLGYNTYKKDDLDKQLQYLLYDKPFSKLQYILDKGTNEELKEYIKGYYLRLENILEKYNTLDKKYIERIKTSCYWHKKLHYRMYHEKNRLYENQYEDFNSYYKNILKNDYKELYNICKLVKNFDTM
jgi:hypothetical protein